MLRDPRELVHNITEAKYNWKNANEEEFAEALEQELHADAECFECSIQMVLNKNRTQASPDELDNAVKFINECMEHVAEKTIPTCQMCSQSKRWWNNDLTKAFKEMRTTRDMAKSYFQHFHQWSEIMLSEVKWLQKKALALVKSAKCEYYLKLTEGADTQNMWNFRKWTNGK